MDPMLSSKKMSHSQMDTKFRVSKPRFFSLKKWTLFTVMIFNLLFLLLTFFLRREISQKIMDYLKEQLNEEAQKQLQATLELALPLFALLGLLITLFFMYGVLRHVVWIVTIYAGLLILGSLGYALEAVIFSPLFWVNCVLSGLLGVIAVLYVRDLIFIGEYMGGRKRLGSHAAEV